MKGTILDFSPETNAGIISGDDQNRYSFRTSEWHGDRVPQIGDQVDFTINDFGQAQQIYLVAGQAAPFQNQQYAPVYNQDTVNPEEERYSAIDWFVKCVTSHYFNFSGRARRKEFWFFMLFCFVIGIFTSIIDAILGSQWVSSIVNLALLVPSLSVGARRLHDIGRSGWWQLLAFTVIGIILLIIWWVMDTKRENNKFGAPAK